MKLFVLGLILAFATFTSGKDAIETGQFPDSSRDLDRATFRCPESMSPVCGSNGKTYGNKCKLAQAQPCAPCTAKFCVCHRVKEGQDGYISLKHEGKCKTEELDKVPACSKRRIRCYKFGRMFGPRCVNGKWQCCAHGRKNYCKQPKPKKTACKDLAKSCAFYSKHGYCKGKYARWMSRNCKKTCKKCPDNDTKDKVPACSKRRIRCFKFGRMFGPRCVNGKWQCCAHGRRNYCKQPKINKTTCKDLARRCTHYNKYGLCEGKYAKWMSKNCKKTCKKCSGNENKETTCKDLAKTCARYSKRGYCKTRYGRWMSKNCKKTCNKCN